MRRFSIVGLIVGLFCSSAAAQGILISVHPHHHPVPLPRPIVRPQPAPPSTYKIKELSVQNRIVDQVARVQVSQSFVNTGSRQMEVCFVFPLPYDGAIDSLTFLVDGKEYAGKLLPAKEARSIYEGFIRRNQDPALLEWIGTGMFKTSVFPVPPGAERKVTLRYSQLLRKSGKLTDFLFPLSTAKYTSHPVEKVDFRVTIESSSEIKSVYSPSHAVNVERPDAKHATVTYQAKDSVPTNDFRLFYDVAEGQLGASVLSYRPESGEDGFFLLLASPQIKAASSDRLEKNVIFVVDRSGSMSGKKIEQAREALKFVLNNLREGDLFNIVAYDSSVESFRPELQRYDDSTRKATLGFVEGIYAGGSTNIDGALSSAMAMIQDDSRPNFVIFLTDGQPTAGETNEMKIVEKIQKLNKLRARVISFGVGYDVNSRLLDRLTRANFGQSEYVRPDEDIEAHVSRLYSRMDAPVMTDVAVDFDFDEARAEHGPPVNRMYPGQVHDLFAGEQLVIAGRYKKHGLAKVTIRGKVGKEKRKFDFPATLAEKSNDQSFAFVEKLWAMRRIGKIIDELDLSGRNEELIKELVALSTKHGILTPYTSFLADDTASLKELANANVQLRRAGRALEQLAQTEGRSAFAQRAQKKSYQSAPRPAADAAPGFGLGGSGGAKFRNIESDREESADSVQNVGNETLFKRGKRWVAANAVDVDLQRDRAKIVELDRFTDDYFKLTQANTDAENRILAAQQPGEELLVKLRGKVYLIK